MKTAVRYYTKSGNTKKLAEAVAEAAGAKAMAISEPLTEDVDVLFLASSVYAAGISDDMKKFIATIDVKVGEIVNISSAAIIKSTYNQVKGEAEKNGLQMSDKEYHCRGQFTLLHRGHPNKDDLKGASEFAERYLANK